MKMIRRLCFVFVSVLVPASSLLASQTNDWIKLAPEGGGFAVMMPGKPTEKVNTAADFTTHLFTLSTEQAIYLAGYGDYSPSIKLDINAELIANRDNFLKALDARLIDSKQISIDNRAGIEFTGESDQASFKSRVFLFGNRVHQIGVAVFKGKDEAANVDRFFGSFSFTKP